MPETNGPLAAALSYLETHTPDFLATLKDLSRIPSVSADGFPRRRSRARPKPWPTRCARPRVENVQVLEIPGVHPYVYGDWLHKPGAPTILLYGHHDVQPPGPPREVAVAALRAHRARRPALRPRHRRRQGRGAWPTSRPWPPTSSRRGELPCNVKFVIEGEEEIGSENLGRFLEKYKDMMAADFIVLVRHRELRHRHSRADLPASRDLPGRRRGARPRPAGAQRDVGRARARSRADPVPAHRRPAQARTASSTSPASTRRSRKPGSQAAQAHPQRFPSTRRSSRRTRG